MAKKKKKNIYFTQDHEDAIVQYNNTENLDIRENLYRAIIGPVFQEMIEKIVNTFKYNDLPNINNLKEECCVYLMLNIHKFNPEKGYAAFSYFSVVIKNWFIGNKKENYKRITREVLYDNINQVIPLNTPSRYGTRRTHMDIFEDHSLTTSHGYEERRESEEFWSNLYSHLENWEQLNLKEQEIKVIKALQWIVDNLDNIEAHNKKGYYFYIKELTRLNTKQVTNNLKKIKAKYKVFKEQWDEGEI